MGKRLQEIFREDSCYKVFFAALIIAGLGYGIYKGVLDNICCFNYVLDSIISLASMASNVYVQDLSDDPNEMRATISTGVSVNHLISVIIALFGGWIWHTVGVETLFMVSAALGLCNSAYAATINAEKDRLR